MRQHPKGLVTTSLRKGHENRRIEEAKETEMAAVSGNWVDLYATPVSSELRSLKRQRVVIDSIFIADGRR